jgi:hypothetical protein
MNTNFRGTEDAHPMGEGATLPITRLASRTAALLRLAGTTLPRKLTLHALPDNSLAAHSAPSNYGFQIEKDRS